MERMLLFNTGPNKIRTKTGEISEIAKFLDYGVAHNVPFSWVQLHNGRAFDHALIKDYPEAEIKIDEGSNALFDAVIELCKSRNVKVSYMFGEFSPLDVIFQKYPAVQDLNTGLFWKFIYDGISALCQRFPKLDEIGVFLFESDSLLTYTNFFRCLQYGHEEVDVNTGKMKRVASPAYPYYSLSDMIRLLITSVSRACRDNGKSFCLLTHA